MPEWHSPMYALLRSGARASGAMQEGLERAAASQDALRALNQLAWIELAVEVVFASISSPGSTNVVSASGVAISEARTPGGGVDPFRVAAPSAASKPGSTHVGESAPRPEALQAVIDQTQTSSCSRSRRDWGPVRLSPLEKIARRLGDSVLPDDSISSHSPGFIFAMKYFSRYAPIPPHYDRGPSVPVPCADPRRAPASRCNHPCHHAGTFLCLPAWRCSPSPRGESSLAYRSETQPIPELSVACGTLLVRPLRGREPSDAPPRHEH